MMDKTLLPFCRAAALAVLVSCQAAPREPGEILQASDSDIDSIAAHVGAVPVGGEPFAPRAQLKFPTRIAAVGTKVVLLDARGDSLVSIFDARSGELLDAFGNRLGNPSRDGFSDAWDVAPVAGDTNAFWLLELRNQRLTHVALNSVAEGRVAQVGRRVELPGDEPVTGAVQLMDSSFASVGYFTGGRFAYFDPTGRFMRFVGPVPPGDTSVLVQIRQHAYQSILKSSPDRSQLAVATRHAGHVSIFSSDGRFIRAAITPSQFEPDYNQEPNAARMILSQNAKIGYLDLATTERNIFGLFSGRLLSKKRSHAYSATYIHVFDWYGRLDRVIKLDMDAVAIAVNPVTGILYTVPRAVEVGLRQYDLAPWPQFSAEKR